MPRAIFLKKIKYKSSLSYTFKYGTKLVSAFGIQPIHDEYALFSFEFSKVPTVSAMIYVLTHAESARLVNQD